MTDFLRFGTARLRAFFLLIALTGLASLALNALDATENPWTTPLQTLLAFSVPVRGCWHLCLRAGPLFAPALNYHFAAGGVGVASDSGR